jgi:hypothetical protein
MQSGGDLANGSSEPVDGDDNELVALPKPAHALGPARPIATGAPGRGVDEDAVRDDPCSRNSILLLIDGLLPGGNPKVRSNTHCV